MAKHSLPEWVGWLEVMVAVVLIFPAFATMYESNDIEIWKIKIKQLGILYTVGMLFYAFASWIIIFALLALGVDTIRSRDKNTD